MPRGKEFRGGQYGNTRGKEKQRRRAEARERDPRYRAAMDQVAADQKALNDLIEEQKRNPAMGAVAGAMFKAQREDAEAKLAVSQGEVSKVDHQLLAEVESDVPEVDTEKFMETARELVQKFSVRNLPRTGDGLFQFAETTARGMLKQGYNLAYVCEFTGLGWEELKNLGEYDREGYLIRDEEDEDGPEDH